MPDDPTHLARFFWVLLGLFGVVALIAAPIAYLRDDEHAIGSVISVLGVICVSIAAYLRRRDWESYISIHPQSRVAVWHRGGERDTYQLDALGAIDVHTIQLEGGEGPFTAYEVRASNIAQPLCVTQFRWLAERRMRTLRRAVEASAR